MADQGIVYILTNPAMPGFVKIGKSQAGGLQSRMSSLQTSGVPLPFECHRASLVDDYDRVERLVHDIFDDYRTNPRREFFRVAVERAVAALLLVELEDVTPGRDILSDNPIEAAAQQAALDQDRAANADKEHIDTIIVPARPEAADGSGGFRNVFLGENMWYDFRIAAPFRERVKWIAAYQIRPVQAVTHIAEIARFEPSPRHDGYWVAIFDGKAQALPQPIPHGEAISLMQAPRYANKEKLLRSESLAELFRNAQPA